MKTGIVIKRDGNKAIVMLSGGAFTSVNTKAGWSKGDVVAVENERFSAKLLYTAAACFLFLFLSGFSGFRLYYTETSLISMDINPSIEMGVNRFDRVIRVSAYNDDSIAVLDSVNLLHKSYTDAVERFLTSEALTPYLFEEKVYVKLAVHTDIPKKSDAMSNALNSGIESLTVQQAVLIPDCEIVSYEIVNQAHEHGLTSGKYTEILEIKELAPETDIDEYRNMSIREIREVREHIHEEIIAGAHEERTEHQKEEPVRKE